MQMEDKQRARHSPWLEPVFTATNSRNHTNPPQTPLCNPQNKKQFGGTQESCIHFIRGCLFVPPDISLAEARAGEDMSLGREVSQVGGLVLD